MVLAEADKVSQEILNGVALRGANQLFHRVRWPRRFAACHRLSSKAPTGAIAHNAVLKGK